MGPGEVLRNLLISIANREVYVAGLEEETKQVINGRYALWKG